MRPAIFSPEGSQEWALFALIDEATGYQADRARDALAKILEEFIAKELQDYARCFTGEFYKELFRIRGLTYDGGMKRPQYIGHLSNDLMYSRLAPGVLKSCSGSLSEMLKEGSRTVFTIASRKT